MAIRGRVFAGLGAVLFLLTSSALTILVILTSNNSSSTANTTISAQASASCPSGFNVNDGNKLAGYTPPTSAISHLEIGNLKIGSGPVVKTGATVTACYIGALASNGVIFDASSEHGGPQTFSLNSVIEGWKLGIPGMHVGGTRELIIPSGLAYGSQKVGSIPPNSNLVFLVYITNTN